MSAIGIVLSVTGFPASVLRPDTLGSGLGFGRALFSAVVAAGNFPCYTWSSAVVHFRRADRRSRPTGGHDVIRGQGVEPPLREGIGRRD